MLFDDGESWDIDSRKQRIMPADLQVKEEPADDGDIDGPQLSVTESDQCLICRAEFGEMDSDTMVYELSCQHAFCADCITQWFSSAD